MVPLLVVVHHGGTLITQHPFKYINGEIAYWEVDLDKWSFFEILGALKDLGYLHVKELFYKIENVLHQLDDDKGAINMMWVANYLRKVDLYVVHGVDHAEVVEDNEPEVGVQLLLTQGELVNEGDKSEEESAGNEVETGLEVEDSGAKEVDGKLQVEESGGNEVDGGLQVDGGVQEEIVVESQVENEVESKCELDNEVEVEVESEGGGDGEVEVESEDEGHMDHLSGDEYVEEEEEIGFGLEDNDEECKAEVNLTPQNSGSENESEDRPQPGSFQTYEKQKSMTDYKWEVWTVFADKAHFIEAIRTYYVHTGRALKFVKNDKRMVRVRCMGGQGKCPWTTYCDYLPTRQFWQLSKIKHTQSCNRQLNIKILNTKWLSEEIDRCLQDNPNLKYRRIHDYAHELLRSNPGSTVKVEVDSVNGEADFKRSYVCLKGCKESFVSCRKIICLDECFLKGQYKGELLTAFGRDPNDQMLPLAYAIVEVENKETWSWFLQLLVQDLGGNEGLMHAIDELLPRADQRLCMRHLYANFRKSSLMPWHRCAREESRDHVMSLFEGRSLVTLLKVMQVNGFDGSTSHPFPKCFMQPFDFSCNAARPHFFSMNATPTTSRSAAHHHFVISSLLPLQSLICSELWWPLNPLLRWWPLCPQLKSSFSYLVPPFSKMLKIQTDSEDKNLSLRVDAVVRDLRRTPRVLVGHSFGGKVVLSVVDQAAKPLARPVRAMDTDNNGAITFDEHKTGLRTYGSTVKDVEIHDLTEAVGCWFGL
ncbi:hypothetical protein V8G54_022493 [Vigna mungo]|uniref:EF-hand domain-containing protein n=1 Tax=Vigna mungo TaxID=3915 RepID=A0AAQ3N398_VIGMU